MYSTNNVSTQQGGDGGMQENQQKKGIDQKMILCWCNKEGMVQGKRINQKMS
jgi:hypothetical protein